jgi:hypothetical protein
MADKDVVCIIGQYGHVYARKILGEDARTVQLTDAVPDEKARHQQASERRQVCFEIVRRSGYVITPDGDALLALSLSRLTTSSSTCSPGTWRSNNSDG